MHDFRSCYLILYDILKTSKHKFTISVVVIIGSAGLIRQATLALYNTVKEHNKIKFEDFVIIAIPSTLWPEPSYKSADMMHLRDHTYLKSDDNTTKKAFKVI